MTGRWQREGVHAGTPTDPVIKHLDGIPWYAAPLPWALHRLCRPQTVELWWERRPGDWSSSLPAGGRLFCACGGTLDLEREDGQGWVGRNSRRGRRGRSDLLSTVEPVALSAQSGARVMVGR